MPETWYDELHHHPACFAFAIERTIQNARATLDGHTWLEFIEACSDRFTSLATDWDQHDDEAFPATDERELTHEGFIFLCDRCSAALEAQAEAEELEGD